MGVIFYNYIKSNEDTARERATERFVVNSKRGENQNLKFNFTRIDFCPLYLLPYSKKNVI